MLAEEYRLGGTCISQTIECETSCVLTCVRVNRVAIAVHDRFGSAKKTTSEPVRSPHLG